MERSHLLPLSVKTRQMKVKVTFEDVIEVENEEQAYDLLIDYCNEVAKNEDVTAFVFEEVE